MRVYTMLGNICDVLNPDTEHRIIQGFWGYGDIGIRRFGNLKIWVYGNIGIWGYGDIGVGGKAKRSCCNASARDDALQHDRLGYAVSLSRGRVG